MLLKIPVLYGRVMTKSAFKGSIIHHSLEEGLAVQNPNFKNVSSASLSHLAGDKMYDHEQQFNTYFQHKSFLCWIHPRSLGEMHGTDDNHLLNTVSDWSLAIWRQLHPIPCKWKGKPYWYIYYKASFCANFCLSTPYEQWLWLLSAPWTTPCF